MNLQRLLRPKLVTVAFHEGDVRWTAGSSSAIAASGSARLPGGVVRDGVISDPETAAQALVSSPGFPGPRTARAIIALPAHRSVFRQLIVPSIRRPELDEMVEREIRREMPMLHESAYVSWAAGTPASGNVTIIVVGTPRDVLDSHLAAMRIAGVPVEAADLRVIAAARAIGDADAIVVNAEPHEVELAIIRDGVPSIIRHVPMTHSETPEAWVDQLAAELARTVKFYRDSHRDDAVVPDLPVMFVGAEARRAVLAEDITQATGHSLAQPPLRLAVTPEDQTPIFAANVGLMLKEAA